MRGVQYERCPLLLKGRNLLAVRLLKAPVDWKLVPGGAAAFVAVHYIVVLAWPRVVRSQPAMDGWWLNASSTVAAVFAAMAVVSWLVLRRAPKTLATSTVAWLAGTMLGMTLALFAVGPGTIWPIVLVVGWTVLAVSVAIGAGAVALTQRGELRE